MTNSDLGEEQNQTEKNAGKAWGRKSGPNEGLMAKAWQSVLQDLHSLVENVLPRTRRNSAWPRLEKTLLMGRARFNIGGSAMGKNLVADAMDESLERWFPKRNHRWLWRTSSRRVEAERN